MPMTQQSLVVLLENQDVVIRSFGLMQACACDGHRNEMAAVDFEPLFYRVEDELDSCFRVLICWAQPGLGRGGWLVSGFPRQAPVLLPHQEVRDMIVVCLGRDALQPAGRDSNPTPCTSTSASTTNQSELAGPAQ
jgi:hypothetical protein